MKIGVTKSCLFVTMLAIAGVSSGVVRAEDTYRADRAVNNAQLRFQTLQPEEQPALRQNSPYGNNPFGGGGSAVFYSGVRPGTNATSAIRKAAEAVRDSKGDEAKSDAQKKLAELLSKCYDDDMVQREHELKQIEERLAKLRELLERRRTKKQEIIDLQTKVALNEAEGLGFYDNERPAKAGSFGFALPPHYPVDAAAGTVSAVPVPEPVVAPTAPKAPKASPR